MRLYAVLYEVVRLYIQRDGIQAQLYWITFIIVVRGD